MRGAWFARLCVLLALTARCGPLLADEPIDEQQARQPSDTRQMARQRLAQAVARAAESRLVQWRESGLRKTATYQAIEALREMPAGAVALFYWRTDSAEAAQLLRSEESALAERSPSAERIIVALLREPGDLRRRLRLAELHEAVADLATLKQSPSAGTSETDIDAALPPAARLAAERGAWSRGLDHLRSLLGEVAPSGPGSDDCLTGLAPRCQPWLEPPAPDRLQDVVAQAGQLIAFDRQAARDGCEELAARQAKLLATLEAAELSETAVGPLIDEQTAIARELSHRVGLLGRTTAMRRALTATQAAADAAGERLFALDRKAALAAAQSAADHLQHLYGLMRRAGESPAPRAAGETDLRSAAWTVWRDRLARMAAQFEQSRDEPVERDLLVAVLAAFEQLADEQRLPPWADAELTRSTIELRAALAAGDETTAVPATSEFQIRQTVERVASAVNVEIDSIAEATSPARPAVDSSQHAGHESRFTPDADLTSAPWFDKLPPENQRAIVAGRHAPPPRGFAERLQRAKRKRAAPR